MGLKKGSTGDRLLGWGAFGCLVGLAGAARGATRFFGGLDCLRLQVLLPHESDEDAVTPVVPEHPRDDRNLAVRWSRAGDSRVTTGFVRFFVVAGGRVFRGSGFFVSGRLRVGRGRIVDRLSVRGRFSVGDLFGVRGCLCLRDRFGAGDALKVVGRLVVSGGFRLLRGSGRRLFLIGLGAREPGRRRERFGEGGRWFLGGSIRFARLVAIRIDRRDRGRDVRSPRA